MNSHRWLIFHCTMAMCAGAVFPCRAIEYEVQGIIRQTITDYNVPKLETSHEFTVYVRDCGWLIKTTEGDGKGHAWQREVGSPQGKEIYEVNANQAFISGDGIPVELLDKGVDGHLWLMFASRCYWSGLHTDQLPPVFNWHASVGANPNLKVTAEWELLNGPGSLPREVRYLGQWDETNGLYTITGTNSVGGVLVPSGFVFEERYAVAQKGMVLRKRVEAQVTSVHAVCSRKDLIPARASAKTVIVDWRLPSSGNNISSYKINDIQKWLSVEEARKIAPPIASSGSSPNVIESTSRKRAIVMGLLCASILLGPVMMIYSWIKTKKVSRSK